MLKKIEASSAREMMLGVAQAIGYSEVRSAPAWWATFWSWFLAFTALAREDKLIGATKNATPFEAMRWFFARALMENGYNEEAAHDDMADTIWYAEACAEYDSQEYSNPLQTQYPNESVCVVVDCGAAETNPWNQQLITVSCTAPELTPAENVDFRAEVEKMAAEERSEYIDKPQYGDTLDDPNMTPEHRMAIAKPGDKVLLTEAQPAKCLIGANEPKLDDDKVYPDGSYCVEQGHDPIAAERRKQRETEMPEVSPENQFGSSPYRETPTRPNRHQRIYEPGDDRPVEERLSSAQPGQRISLAEKPPEKCLMGAPAVLPDDDVIYPDSAYCNDSRAHVDPENDDDDDDDGLEPFETEQSDEDLADDDVGPDGEIGPSFSENTDELDTSGDVSQELADNARIDDSVEPDRSVPAEPTQSVIDADSEQIDPSEETKYGDDPVP